MKRKLWEKTRRTVPALIAMLLLGTPLTGCGETVSPPVAADYVLNEQTGGTSCGVIPGDTPETFLAAYGEYKLFTSTDGGETYQVPEADEIPFDSDIDILLPAFFIDGVWMEPVAFCKENGIGLSDLMPLLRSGEYLAAHHVEYRHLLFQWENGTIKDISSSYMDYNAESEYL